MIDDAVRQRILEEVDRAFDAQISFTQELVRYPSVRTREESVQDAMFAAMQERGLEMDRWELDPAELETHPGSGPTTVSYSNMTNVVGTYRPAEETGRSLILNGHVDVVPEGPHEVWSRSPWDPFIADGWLYGRGAGDMKAGLAANLFAFDAVLGSGVVPNGRIHFQSVVEEECTGNGTLSAHMRGYTADAVIIPEPEEDMLVRANVGVIWARVRVSGRPVHPREMSTGFNAVDAAYGVMEELRRLEEKWNAEHADHRYFEHLEHPINFNVGTIAGGDWPSTVPAWCEFELRAALYPGVTADDAWAAIQESLARAAARLRVDVSGTRSGFYSEGYVLEPGSDAERVLTATHQRVFGSELESFTTPGYIDARVFVLYDRVPCLVYGPISESIHGFDERVSIESVRRITKSIALFIAEWCGVSEPQRSSD